MRLALQCRRNLAIKKLNRGEQVERAIDNAQPRVDPFHRLHARPEFKEPETQRVPIGARRGFAAVYSRLQSVSGGVGTRSADYRGRGNQVFPAHDGNQDHERGLGELLAQEDRRVARDRARTASGIYRAAQPGAAPDAWSDQSVSSRASKFGRTLYRRHTEPTPDEIKKYGAPSKNGTEKIFEAREIERDSSFLRRYLTEELMREMDMFEYEPRGDELVIDKVSDEEGWKQVKETLIKSVGTGTIPVIKVEDADFGHNRTLYLKHYHDGRDLQLEYAEKTLAFVQRLWGHECVLETTLQGKRSLLCFNDRGFSMRALK